MQPQQAVEVQVCGGDAAFWPLPPRSVAIVCLFPGSLSWESKHRKRPSGALVVRVIKVFYSWAGWLSRTIATVASIIFSILLLYGCSLSGWLVVVPVSMSRDA